LTRILCRWACAAHRWAWLTLGIITPLTVGFGVFAVTHLSFNVDPNALFSADLRFQKMIREFSRYFPVLTDSLLTVVDGDSIEAVRRAQVDLAEGLARRRDVFHRVFLPGEEPYFERHGMLYASVDELDEFADNMALLQPLLAELSKNPSLPTLASIIRLGLGEKDRAGISPERWQTVLDRFRSATVSVFEEYPLAVSWESLLLADSSFDPDVLRVIVADPILEQERILAADTAIQTVRDTARQLGLGPARGVRVRVSGYPALNHEEMLGLANDTALAGALSLILVVAVLVRAFHSLRMVLAAAITLLVGLTWSAAFAAATVAELNPVSIVFGILVIGLGVDFMIHLGMHFVESARAGGSSGTALEAAVADTGGPLILCAATTTVGFLAFVPTDYRGVSDLGLAASGGMMAILLLTSTLFPALIRVLLPPPALVRLATVRPPRRLPLGKPPPVLVVAVALFACVAAIPLLPRVDLDTNVVRMRNPRTESVQAFGDLLDSTASTPWYLDALAPSLDEADRIAAAIRPLPGVDRVVTLTDFVPKDQNDKIEILRDVSFMLDLSQDSPAPDSTAEQIEALVDLRDFLDTVPITGDVSGLAGSVRKLRQAIDGFLVKAENGDTAAVLAELDRVLLEPLPGQLDRLRESLEVDVVNREDLPAGLVSRMLAKDGHARLLVYPAEQLVDHSAMVNFVETIRPVWKDITGLPVNLVESARATWASLREAMLWAVLAISALLLLLWRRVGDTLIALVPLLLAVLLTQVSTVILPISFNFVNVIVLPLILGIGIDSGVHLVYRASRLGVDSSTLLASTTARAVFYSALTTLASFGTLSLSHHRGVASLGMLLVVGMILTLVANLILLPALLSLRGRLRGNRA
jgi:hopanoid biosynthesis associated RND transporter like protein HpnN